MARDPMAPGAGAQMSEKEEEKRKRMQSATGPGEYMKAVLSYPVELLSFPLA